MKVHAHFEGELNGKYIYMYDYLKILLLSNHGVPKSTRLKASLDVIKMKGDSLMKVSW